MLQARELRVVTIVFVPWSSMLPPRADCTDECADDPRQPTLKAFVVSAKQQQEFETKFAKFMYTTLTPFHRLDFSDLKLHALFWALCLPRLTKQVTLC